MRLCSEHHAAEKREGCSCLARSAGNNMLADGAVHLWRGAAAGSAGAVMDVYAQLEALLGSLNLPPDAPICLARQARAARPASLAPRGAPAAHRTPCSSAWGSSMGLDTLLNTLSVPDTVGVICANPSTHCPRCGLASEEEEELRQCALCCQGGEGPETKHLLEAGGADKATPGRKVRCCALTPTARVTFSL